MTETTLNIRGIDREAATRIKRAAHSRDMTVGQFLAHLIDFHDVARARADAGGDDWRVELETRGLQTVRM